MINLLDKLNDSQRDAVTYCDGAQLVIAGAGSGKTRVLTYKIAYLLQQPDLQLMPWNILALTFTNKAAKEMKQRVGQIVGQDLAHALFMGTFHSIFARILRHEATRLGYTSRFTIYDDADSRSLISTIVKEMGLSDKEYKASNVLHRIGMAKNRLITADKYANEGSIRTLDAQQQMPELYKVYRIYEQRCKMANVMDFDDLLVNTWTLFNQFPEVCSMYAERFKYILVDEYQDTNYVQQCIIYQLAREHKRICVVGDDAQSIYGFRGANIDNILSFERQYAGARMFKLERNYRSTQTIVKAANSLIAHNQRQIRKDVYSENSKGEKLQLFEAYSDRLEAVHVCDTISKLKRMSQEGLYSDYAILYRTNAQSRLFEDELRIRGIPYTIYGGLSFYQRKEIKDIISYFRAIINPDDEEALKRIINYPTRGIGTTTVQKIAVTATENEVSLWEIISQPATYNLPVNKGTATKLLGFVALINELRNNLEKLNAAELGEMVIRDSGIHREIFADNSPEGLARQENIEELINELQAFVDDRMEEDNHSAVGLIDFLQEVSLLSDVEHNADNEDQNEKGAVSLMTIHAAKGLEFPVVFIVGLEENIFPSLRSCDSQRLLEEERRLLYVAITRAEQKCYLSCAKTRYRFGKTEYDPPSRFLKDIDPHYIQHVMQNIDETQFGDNWNMFRSKSFSGRTSFSREANRSDNKSDNKFTLKRENTHSVINSVNDQPLYTKDIIGGSFKKMSTQISPKTNNATSVRTSSTMTSVGTLSQGTIIEHQRFGRGEVQSIEGSGENLKVTVRFESGVGTKQLLVKFARFTIVKS